MGKKFSPCVKRMTGSKWRRRSISGVSTAIRRSRSGMPVILLDADMEDALDIHLVQGQGDNGVGGHDKVVGVSIEVIDQSDGQGGTRPGHERDPGPASHTEEADQDDDANQGGQEIDAAGEHSQAQRRESQAMVQRTAQSALQNVHFDERFEYLDKTGDEENYDPPCHDRDRHGSFVLPDLSAALHPAGTPREYE